MPRIMAIDRFYMGQLYDGGEVYEVSEATLALIKEKKMTHHIQRLDKQDTEIEKASAVDLEKTPMPELRAIAEDRGIDHEGLKKAELIAAIQASIAAQV